MRTYLSSFLVVLIGILTIACGEDAPDQKSEHSFHQTFESPVAAVSADRNHSPIVTATAYLINKREGYFLTADHFVDAPRLLHTNEFKLFVNGRVYKASPVRVFQLYDIAVIGIKGDFDPEDLSEPFELAQGTVAVGDTVYARGIHVHPGFLRKKNEDRGRAGKAVPIMRDYYGHTASSNGPGREFVYDDLKAVVSAVNERMKINYGSSGAVTPRIQKARHQSNRYFYIDIDFNHIISFGGLSGGPVVNQDNKLVGIITAEKPRRPDKGKGSGPVYDRITITYIDLVRDEISRYFGQ